MNNPDQDEKDLLQSYEDGELVSPKPSQKEKEQFKSAAHATAFKDRRVNIGLSGPTGSSSACHGRRHALPDADRQRTSQIHQWSFRRKALASKQTLSADRQKAGVR